MYPSDPVRDRQCGIEHVLAVVPVSDFEAAQKWYERLFGRPANDLPMEGRLVEWRVTECGWLQVTADTARAGATLLNFRESTTSSASFPICPGGACSLGGERPSSKGVHPPSGIRPGPGRVVRGETRVIRRVGGERAVELEASRPSSHLFAALSQGRARRLARRRRIPARAAR